MAEKSGEDIFNQLAKEEPLRTDEIDESSYNGGGGDRTLDDYERESPNLTDLQSLIKTLSPDFQDDLYNVLAMAKLAPEKARPLLKLLVNDEMRRNRGKSRSIVRIATNIYVAITLAIDGKHTVDILEAYGSRSSGNEIDTLSAMNLGG
jgi:hypothetical protein